MIDSLVDLGIVLVVLFVLVLIIQWVLGYLHAPDIVGKVLYVLAGLVAVLAVLEAFGVYHGSAFHFRRQ